MKVSIGTNIKEGPWGGGNLFAINLTNYLKKQGVVFLGIQASLDVRYQRNHLTLLVCTFQPKVSCQPFLLFVRKNSYYLPTSFK